ncbi:hypothetical protein GZ77_07205 [Endozoicomonas montiporae]|uniref:Phage tail protein n=2 Tax=Endozoicomonas montiporae TaxID=1027273 RepID=A0A081N6Y6_9GAMM|nr:DUF2586 domain-containing protein [Endozoicomonas montiporae]AMO55984.1 phage protein [Endozoicomonas montiporae CL-33]KEQ14209.1 hypothetical protein GZ77_07205 [Endozoicomonas montiporae]
MALGSVTVNNLNLNQGTPTEVERLFLFTGLAPAPNDNLGLVHAIAADTDLDELLGQGDSPLKTQLAAARTNGGQNWYAYAKPLSAQTDLLDAIDDAVGEVSVEAVVATDPVTQTKQLEDMEAKAQSFIGKYQRRVFIMACFRGIDKETESWAEYQIAGKAVSDSVAAERVVLVPLFYGDFQGVLAGRLCNRAVTVADSPMRVATGSLLGNYAERPVDKSGAVLTKAVLLDLHDNGRFTVPQWYEDYDGMYTSDCLTLAPETSDYKIIENLRVADKAARRIYLLAVARVSDRRLNSTPASIESNRTYFMRPLREMSHSTTFAGETFPGEIEQPDDSSIEIVWPEKYKVQVFFSVKPYNAPKSIECNIMLDLSNG